MNAVDAPTSLSTTEPSDKEEWLTPGELYFFKAYINGEVQAAFYEVTEENGMVRKTDAENIIRKALNSSTGEIQKQEPLRHFLAKIDVDNEASKDRIDKICDTMRAMHYIEKRAIEIDGLLKKTKQDFVKLQDKYINQAQSTSEMDEINDTDCDFIIQKMVEITERLEFIESSVPVIKSEFKKLRNIHTKLVAKKAKS